MLRMSECEFIAFTAYTVDDHIIENHEDLTKKCKDCDFTGGKREILKHRSENHKLVGKDYEPYSCQKCDFASTSFLLYRL